MRNAHATIKPTTTTSITFRKKDWRVGSEEIEKLTQPDHFYRGMTEAEFNNTVGANKGIKSNQSFSTIDEGTSWADNAQDAEDYVNFGRDDPRTTGKPNYLIEIKGSEGLLRTRDGYYKAKDEIPRNRITHIWKMSAKDNAIVGVNIHTAASVETIHAFHGSPFNFSKFNIKRIGSGEGAQVYGYGLYFATLKDVALSYIKKKDRQGHFQSVSGILYEVTLKVDPNKLLNWDKTLSEQTPYVVSALRTAGLLERKTYLVNGRPLSTVLADFDPLIRIRVRNALIKASGNLKMAALELRNSANQVTPKYKAQITKAILRLQNATIRVGQEIKPGMGMHIEKDLGITANGATLPSQAVHILLSIGIPGIVYKDQFSRNYEEPQQETHNYVIFDTSIITILNKTAIDKIETATVHDGDKHFIFDELTMQEIKQPASRSTLVYMSPKQYLDLITAGHDEDKLANTTAVLTRGAKYKSLPYLMIDEHGQVVAQEARHRIMALDRIGVKSIPVILRSTIIRWGEPKYYPQIPKFIIPENYNAGDIGRRLLVKEDIKSFHQERKNLPMPDSEIFPRHIEQAVDKYLSTRGARKIEFMGYTIELFPSTNEGWAVAIDGKIETTVGNKIWRFKTKRDAMSYARGYCKRHPKIEKATMENSVRFDKAELPEDVTKAFVELAELQRGVPERTMVRAQHAVGGGLINILIEHVGDIVHRMNHHLQYGEIDYSAVDKIRKTYRWITEIHNNRSAKDYSKEQFKGNAHAMEIPLEDYMDKITGALIVYAKAHDALPCYNKIQYYAKQAAIQLGYLNWDEARDCLYILNQLIKDEATWKKAVLAYTKNKDGNLLQYVPGSTMATATKSKAAPIDKVNLTKKIEANIQRMKDNNYNNDWNTFQFIVAPKVTDLVERKPYHAFFNRDAKIVVAWTELGHYPMAGLWYDHNNEQHPIHELQDFIGTERSVGLVRKGKSLYVYNRNKFGGSQRLDHPMDAIPYKDYVSRYYGAFSMQEQETARNNNVPHNNMKIGELTFDLSHKPRMAHTAFMTLMPASTFLHLDRQYESPHDAQLWALEQVRQLVDIPAPYLVINKESFSKPHCSVADEGGFGRHIAKAISWIYNKNHLMPVRIIIPDKQDDWLDLDKIQQVQRRIIPASSDDEIDYDAFDHFYYDGEWQKGHDYGIKADLPVGVSVETAVKFRQGAKRPTVEDIAPKSKSNRTEWLHQDNLEDNHPSFVELEERMHPVIAGLKKWVNDYIIARRAGNIKLAKQLYNNIERQIRINHLEIYRQHIYGADPDDYKINRPKSSKFKMHARTEIAVNLSYQDARLIFKQIVQVDVTGLSPEGIRVAYINWIRKNHPDVGGDVKQVQLVNSAYDTLKNTTAIDEPQTRPAPSPSRPENKVPPWQTDERSIYNKINKQDFTDINYIKYKIWHESGGSHLKWTIWGFDGNAFRGSITVFGDSTVFPLMAQAMYNWQTSGGNNYPCEAIFVAKDFRNEKIIYLIWCDGARINPPVAFYYKAFNKNPGNDQQFTRSLPDKLDSLMDYLKKNPGGHQWQSNEDTWPQSKRDKAWEPPPPKYKKPPEPEYTGFKKRPDWAQWKASLRRRANRQNKSAEIAAKSADNTATIAALKVFVTLIRAYHRHWPSPLIHGQIANWMQEARPFFNKFNIPLRSITPLLTFIDRKTDYVDANKVAIPALLAVWNENLIKIGHSLRDAKPAIVKDTGIPKQLIDMLDYVRRYCTGNVDSGAHNYDMIHAVIPRLGDTRLTQEWVDADPTQAHDYAQEQADPAKKLKTTVQQLTGRVNSDILTFEEARKFTNMVGREKDLYNLYNQLNQTCKKIFIAALAELIRSSGETSINYEKARRDLGNMPINYMPPGFDGNVGYIDKDIKLFTKHGHPLGSGTGVPAGLPSRRDARIIMNPKYDPNSHDNIWVMRMESPGIQNATPYFNVKHVISSRSQKWADVAHDVAGITRFQHKWENDINNNDYKVWLPALVCAFLYQIAARIGSVGNAAHGQDTYGLSTVQLAHMTHSGNNYTFNYPGKDAVEQNQICEIPANIASRVNRRMAMLLAKKKSTDIIFEYNNDRADSNQIAAYMRGIGMKSSAHGFRYIRGTQLAEQIIKASKFKPNPSSKVAVQKQGETWFMDNVAAAVGGMLGHRGGKNADVLKTTCLKSYISPLLMTNWFEGLNLRVPSFVPPLN
jgi:hypothetical protein